VLTSAVGGCVRPFTGKYLHTKQQGTYSCVVCDCHLFSSHHKFESGCGWPAFSDVLSSAAVNLTADNSYVLSSSLNAMIHPVLLPELQPPVTSVSK